LSRYRRKRNGMRRRETRATAVAAGSGVTESA
jgi:hypothetical protein